MLEAMDMVWVRNFSIDETFSEGLLSATMPSILL
jgi:hypothetical protein